MDGAGEALGEAGGALSEMGVPPFGAGGPMDGAGGPMDAAGASMNAAGAEFRQMGATLFPPSVPPECASRRYHLEPRHHKPHPGRDASLLPLLNILRTDGGLHPSGMRDGVGAWSGGVRCARPPACMLHL